MMYQMMKKVGWILIAASSACAYSCKKDSTSSTTDTGTTIGSNVPDVYKKVYGASSITIDGDYVVIKTTGRPEHKSPYYKGTAWESTLYEADTDTGFHANPSKIAAQNYIFRIPLKPNNPSTKPSTPMGPIGVALNGVPLFNQYAGGGQPLGNEIVSFDQYGGHPAQGNDYHYHVEPKYITTLKGKSSLIGFLLDGYPVYGPLEDGKTIANADLDVYHGHTAVTAEYPSGVYHYHTTSVAPYINGNGFYGTPGTVSK